MCKFDSFNVSLCIHTIFTDMKLSLNLDNFYIPNILVIGIVSSLKPHKLAWLLNNGFEVDFCKAEDIFIPIDEDLLPFLNFIHESSHSLLRLVRNRSYLNDVSNKPFFLPEFKEFDFFLLIENSIENTLSNEFIGVIKQLSNVEYVKEIRIEEVKSVENLIFN